MFKKKLIVCSVFAALSFALVVFYIVVLSTQTLFVKSARDSYYNKKADTQKNIIVQNLDKLTADMDVLAEFPSVAEVFTKKTVNKNLFQSTNYVIRYTDAAGRILLSSEGDEFNQKLSDTVMSWLDRVNSSAPFFLLDRDRLIAVRAYQNPYLMNTYGYIVAEMPSRNIFYNLRTKYLGVRIVNDSPSILILSDSVNINDEIASLLAINLQNSTLPDDKAIEFNIHNLSRAVYFVGDDFYTPPLLTAIFAFIFILGVVLSVIGSLRSKNSIQQYHTEHAEKISKLLNDIEQGNTYQEEHASKIIEDASKYGYIKDISDDENSEDHKDLSLKSITAEEPPAEPQTTPAANLDKFEMEDDDNLKPFEAEEEPADEPADEPQEMQKDTPEESTADDSQEIVKSKPEKDYSEFDLRVLSIPKDDDDDFSTDNVIGAVDEMPFEDKVIGSAKKSTKASDVTRLAMSMPVEEKNAEEQITEEHHTEKKHVRKHPVKHKEKSEKHTEHHEEHHENLEVFGEMTHEEIAGFDDRELDMIDELLDTDSLDAQFNNLNIIDEDVNNNNSDDDEIELKIVDDIMADFESDDMEMVEISDIINNMNNDVTTVVYRDEYVSRYMGRLSDKMRRYDITRYSIAEEEQNLFIFRDERFGEQFIIDRDDALFRELLSQGRALVLSDNIASSPYLNGVISEELLNRIGELYIRPIINDNEVRAIAVMARERDATPLDSEDIEDLLI